MKLPSIRPQVPTSALAVLSYLASLSTLTASQPQIVQADPGVDSITLKWLGTAETYEVQSVTNLDAPAWQLTLITARTNATIPATDHASFFRVVDSGSILSNLVLSATNVITDAAQKFTLQNHTPADWRFTEQTSTVLADRAVSNAEFKQFDLLFDSNGGFTVITEDGEGTGRGGRLTRSGGPQDGLFKGYITNATRMVSFSGSGNPAPAGPLLASLLVASGDRVVAPADRSRVLRAIGEKIVTLVGADPAVSSQALAAFLAQFPELEAVGISPDSSVYAQFIDGRPLNIFNNRTGATAAELQRTIDLTPLPAPEPGMSKIKSGLSYPEGTFRALAAQPVTGLPESRQAVLLKATVPGISAPMLNSLVPAFARRGYQVYGDEAGLEQLMNVRDFGRNIGVFYIDSHGGVGDIPRITPTEEGSRGLFRDLPTFILLTSTVTTEEGDRKYSGHFARGELSYGVLGPDVIKADGSIIRADAYYCVTSEFVRRYWKFGRNGFVYIDTCHGGSPAAAAFPRACFDAGAAVYAGWSDRVLDGWAYFATRVFFDTMLGGNNIFTEITPKCRPFDRASVLAYMARRKIDVDQTSNFPGAHLLFTQNSAGGEFGLLNPSIQSMSVDESKDQLNIYGYFDPTTSATVRIEGNGTVERTVQPLSGTQLVVPLSATGSPSAGRVTVTQRQRPSNTVPLTEWKVSGEMIRYFAIGESQPSATYEYKIHLRTDIHPYRRFPYETPAFPGNYSLGASDSTARLASASGIYHDPNGIRTVEWHVDSPTELPYRFINSPDPNTTYFSANATFSEGGILYFVVNARAKDGATSTTTTLVDGSPVESDEKFNPLTRVFSSNGRNGSFNLSSGDIPAGEGSVASDSGIVRWQTSPASFPPDKSVPGYAE